MELVHIYQKKRKEFGRQAFFSDRPAELCYDINSDASLIENFLVRPFSTVEIQNVPLLSEHEANTERFISNSQGVQHVQGGWPKDVDYKDMEHTSRYRKKIEKDDDYVKTILGLAEVKRERLFASVTFNY